MRDDVWPVIAGIALATYLTRAPLLLALARRPLPPRLRLWLRLIPLAVLPALAVPMVLVERGSAVAVSGSFLAGVAVGIQLGGLVADPARWGLDFAFPAVFLALLALQLRRAAEWLVALAVLDVVTLPDRLVEAVIALSIAAVAAENLVLSPVVARRWIVSFCFGLVHGFGFSAALRELGLPAHGLLLSLFGFNAGVEIGQAVVVAVALPSLALLRRTRWERRMVWSSSVAILLVGVILFVERAFF